MSYITPCVSLVDYYGIATRFIARSVLRFLDIVCPCKRVNYCELETIQGSRFFDGNCLLPLTTRDPVGKFFVTPSTIGFVSCFATCSWIWVCRLEFMVLFGVIWSRWVGRLMGFVELYRRGTWDKASTTLLVLLLLYSIDKLYPKNF